MTELQTNCEEPTIVECDEYKQPFIAGVVTRRDHCEELRAEYQEVLRKTLSPDSEDDATKDIVEVPEMTEEVEEAIDFLFQGVENRSDKIKISVQDNGGASVSFKDYNLNVFPTGKRFALKAKTENTEVRFFRDTDRETLAQIIRDILGVFSPKKEKYDARTDLTAPITIKLKKGFDSIGIKKFIRRIDDFLISRKGLPTKVHVTTEDWKDKDPRPFMLIPGAKKMFAKFCEAGLLACLVFNGFMQTAQEVYCIAYVKGKAKGDGVEFKNVDGKDFKKQLMISTQNLHKIPETEVEENEEHVHGEGCSHGHEHHEPVEAPNVSNNEDREPEFSEADKKYLQNLIDAVSSGRK